MGIYEAQQKAVRFLKSMFAHVVLLGALLAIVYGQITTDCSVQPLAQVEEITEDEDGALLFVCIANNE